jgi:hypothetical protein
MLIHSLPSVMGETANEIDTANCHDGGGNLGAWISMRRCRRDSFIISASEGPHRHSGECCQQRECSGHYHNPQHRDRRVSGISRSSCRSMPFQRDSRSPLSADAANRWRATANRGRLQDRIATDRTRATLYKILFPNIRDRPLRGDRNREAHSVWNKQIVYPHRLKFLFNNCSGTMAVTSSGWRGLQRTRRACAGP